MRDRIFPVKPDPKSKLLSIQPFAVGCQWKTWLAKLPPHTFASQAEIAAFHAQPVALSAKREKR